MRPSTRGQLDVRNAERQRIARDIHDDLGQSLLALKMELALVRAAAPAPVGGQIDTIMRHLDASILSLRSIIHDLRPGTLDAGLTAAVRRQLVEFSRLAGVAHTLEVDTELDDQARCVDSTALRIVQELLANVARHARARYVTVKLHIVARQLVLEVHDDGTGLPLPSAESGYGLRGIGERARATGGSLTVECPGSGGTRVRVTLGLPAQ
jgi:signal transduction histidine kinase